MISISSLRVGALLLTAVVATPAAFSQPTSEADAARQQQIIARIEQQERNGPLSEGLVDPLSELALLYQDRGDHDLAVAVIHRIRQLVRANNGLHSLEQIPVIQQLIANEKAIGRLDTAWELEQELLTLAKRHPDDMRTVPVFRESAANRMTLLRQYLAGEFPPQIILGCYYGNPDEAFGCIQGSRGMAIRRIVSDAQENYFNAIGVMHRNDLYSSDELKELELELLRSIEEIRSREPPSPRTTPRITDRDYFFGRETLERMWGYKTTTSAPLHQQLDALVQIADWDLLYSETMLPTAAQVCARPTCVQGLSRAALEKYERAYELLEAARAQASIDDLFSPEIPVVLPAFMPNPLASDPAQTSNRYIDVAFEISRYGEARDVRILDTTTNATADHRARLVRLIQRSRFRPRIANGGFANGPPVRLRYYLTE
jgi:tetratricopeptide (TPR) repeat protein